MCFTHNFETLYTYNYVCVYMFIYVYIHITFVYALYFRNCA